MYVLEVAAQNVRGFSAASRVQLKPGYNLLKPPTGVITPVGQLASAICFSDGRGGDASFLAQGAKAGKAAFTLLGNDQTTYRVLRELGGSGALQKLNPGTQKFETVTEDANEIAQFVRGQVGLPSKGVFELLFCLTASGLPSRRPKKGGAVAGAAPVAPQRTISRDDVPISPVEDVGDAERRLEAMGRELTTARETAQVQFEFDGVVSEIYDIEHKVKMLEEQKAKVTEVEERWKAAPTPASLNLPADLIRRCEHYHEYVAKRDAELLKLKDAGEDEVAAYWEAQLKGKKIPPLWMEREFWFGVGGGAAALLLGVVVPGYFKYVALLDIPAFGFAGVVAYRYVEDIQKAYWETRRGGRKQSREEKVRQDFETQALAVEKAMELLEVEKPEEVIAKLREKDALKDELERLRQKVAEFEADPDYQAKVSRLPEAKADQERLNAQLQARGGYMREPREIEKDLERLRKSIALTKGGGAVSLAASPVASSAGMANPTLEDQSPAILKFVAEALQTDVPGAAAAIRDRALQYFAAFTDKRYPQIDFDLEGRGSVVANGQKMSVAILPPKDADLFCLALKLTAVEKAAARAKVPLFIEDAISCIDEPKLPLLGRMLKHLGTMTQVIHVSAHPGFVTLADASGAL